MAMATAKSLNTLTAGEIHEGMKKGLTTSFFLEKYGCDREKFADKVESLFYKNSSERNRVMKELDRNEAKAQKYLAKKGADKQKNAPTVTFLLVPEECPEQPVEEPDTLEALRELEGSQSSTLLKIESEHKELCRKHLELIERAKDVDKNLDKLRSQLDKTVNAFKQIVEETHEIERQMEAKNAERRKCDSQLEQTRAKIEELLKVSFYVVDGGVELAEGDLEIDTTGYEEIYTDIRDREELEDFRIKDIKALAKALAVRRNTKLPTEFVFDNEELEQLFNSIS